MIKVTTDTNKKEEKPFPKLMISDCGWVVLFSGYEKGILIVEGSPGNPVGYYSESWHMTHFTDYNEPVTIQNV